MTRGQPRAVAPATPPARDLRIVAADGIVLAATYWPGRRADAPAVLLLHGVDSSRADTAANAAWLAGLGYAAMTIDFRGHGQSTPAPRSFGLTESRDAHAAFRWLKQRQRGAPVAVIGISMGGAASLLGPAGPLPADALVLQAVYPDIRAAIRNRIATRLGTPAAAVLEPLLSLQAKPRFGAWPSELSPLSALARFAGPVLVIGGRHDRYTPPRETGALYAAARDGRRLWLVPEGDHGAAAYANDPAYRAVVRQFLAETIGVPK